MELLDRIRDFIKTAEDRDLYIYFGGALGALFILFLLLGYFHYSRVRWYQEQIKIVTTQRLQTRKILQDFKAASTHKAAVEDLLAQNKNFRIGEAFQSLLQRVGLTGKASDISAPATGESVSGKTELIVSAHISSISMKNVTDLLSQIASIPQLYAKDLSIKKSSQGPFVDIDITVATLEPSE